MMMKTEREETVRPSSTEPSSSSQQTKASRPSIEQQDSKKEPERATGVDDGSLIRSSEINDNDVLCGRGAFANRHVGNRRFRELVSSHQENYLTAKILEKSDIASNIVNMIKMQTPPGRFLKRREEGHPSSSTTNTADQQSSSSGELWTVITDRCAKDKTSQALREKAPEVRKRLGNATANARNNPYYAMHQQQHRQESMMYGSRFPLTPESRSPPSDMAGVRVVSAQASPIHVSRQAPPYDSPAGTPLLGQNASSAFHSPPPPSSTTGGVLMSPPEQGSSKSATLTMDGTPISDNDVLCGRGGVTNSHIGNKRFRALVKERQPQYIAAPKLEKASIARDIVNIIRERQPPGRFLAQKKGSSADESGKWFDVGAEKAREKTSQALREKAPEIRNLFTAAAANSMGDPYATPMRSGLGSGMYPPAPGHHQAHYAQPHYDSSGTVVSQMSLMQPELDHQNGTDRYPKRPFHSISRGPGGFHHSSPSIGPSPIKTGNNFDSMLPYAHPNMGQSVPPQGSVTEVNDNDVLFGRGAGVNYHVGNRRFRDLVRANQEHYLAAAKLDKAAIARDIVDRVRHASPGGRFLMKDPKNEGAWVDVGDERAREKTSQALRERAPEIRSRVMGGMSPAGSGEEQQPPHNMYHSVPEGHQAMYEQDYYHYTAPYHQQQPEQQHQQNAQHQQPQQEAHEHMHQQAHPQQPEQWMLCNEMPPPRSNLREAERGPFLKRRRFG